MSCFFLDSIYVIFCFKIFEINSNLVRNWRFSFVLAKDSFQRSIYLFSSLCSAPIRSFYLMLGQKL